jgi:hypothetical protein
MKPDVHKGNLMLVLLLKQRFWRIMEGTDSDRAIFIPLDMEYVSIFGDVESSASVLFLDDCVPHFTITNITDFKNFL